MHLKGAGGAVHLKGGGGWEGGAPEGGWGEGLVTRWLIYGEYLIRCLCSITVFLLCSLFYSGPFRRLYSRSILVHIRVG